MNETRTTDVDVEQGELASLISALREDGVEKGQREADDIVAAAKKEAARIADEARTEADRIVEKAHRESTETFERLESQLSLALRDFLLKVKGRLEDLIALKPLRVEVDKAMSDPEFIKKLIYDMLYGYAKSEAAHETRHLHIAIPEDMRSDFVKKWVEMMRQQLNMVTTLHTEKDLKGFSISAEGGGGMLVVDTDSIIEEIKPFVSEKFQYILDKGEIPKA